MRAARDELTRDLFASVPAPADLEGGALDLRVMISQAMGRAMKACSQDRYEIGARMSRILAPRDVTKNMLDAYAAASRETHIPNLAFCIAFDCVTGQKELINLYAKLLGCAVLVGEEALRAELGQLDLQEREIRTRKRDLTTFLTRKKK